MVSNILKSDGCEIGSSVGLTTWRGKSDKEGSITEFPAHAQTRQGIQQINSIPKLEMKVTEQGKVGAYD